MKSYKKDIASLVLRSMLAGMTIGFGCIAYVLNIDNKILGSFLFSLALLTVLVQEMILYTGKIGFVENIYDGVIMIPVMLFNMVGIYIVGRIITYTSLDFSAVIPLVNAKLSAPDISSFILAICCGVMMYFAVYNFKKEKHPLYVIMPIMCFILCGFEHCIADMGYFAIAAVPFDTNFFIKMGLYIAGNGIGSLIFSKLNIG